MFWPSISFAEYFVSRSSGTGGIITLLGRLCPTGSMSLAISDRNRRYQAGFSARPSPPSPPNGGKWAGLSVIAGKGEEERQGVRSKED